MVNAAAGVWVHLRELAFVTGDLTTSFAARSGEGNSRGWCRVETMMVVKSNIQIRGSCYLLGEDQMWRKGMGHSFLTR